MTGTILTADLRDSIHIGKVQLPALTIAAVDGVLTWCLEHGATLTITRASNWWEATANGRIHATGSTPAMALLELAQELEVVP